MKEAFNDRLIKFINFEKLKKSDFGKRLGRDGSDKSYYTWFAASANPTAKNIEEILMAFPHLNANWLIAGFPPMIQSDSPQMLEESLKMYQKTETLGHETINKMIDNMVKLDEEKRKLEETLSQLRQENALLVNKSESDEELKEGKQP